MSFRLLHEAEARVEFQEAVATYEAQCPGRGVRFTLDVDRVMSAISVQPLRFSEASRNSRKARVVGWPYTIYFAVNEAEREVRVIAVWHGARNPAVLRRRLR
jgi:plasmid stabilization system protein ParE